VSARPEPSRTLLVEIGGRERRVEVNRTDDGWDVSIDGRRLQVDVVEIGGWLSLLAGPPEGGRRPRNSYSVAIDDRGRGELIIHLDGVAITATVRDPRAAWGARGHDPASTTDGRADVRAPMPGRVVKVLVNAGDMVTARQGLVVVEAMKMENELRAPKDGRVADIRVKEGMSVDANAVLMTLE
jgi:acetyl/propionyl-CoA carboxylase alpha subunit